MVKEESAPPADEKDTAKVYASSTNEERTPEAKKPELNPKTATPPVDKPVVQASDAKKVESAKNK